MQKIIFLTSFLLLIIINCNSAFAKTWKTTEYASPAWMDNETIICVKYVDTYKTRLFKWLGAITDTQSIGFRHEIQIVSMDIEGNNEKVIKNIIIDRPGMGRKWREEIFEGVLRINFLTYLAQREIIAFSTHGATKGVFIIKKDGTEAKKIVKLGYCSAFSPDSKHLQYTSNYKVWLYDLDTEEHKVLVEDAMGGPWSPDSKKIAFSRKLDNRSKVFIYDLETKKEESADTHLSSATYWPPDGKFTYFRLMKYPRISPDGTKIVGKPYSNPEKDNRLNYIGVSDVDGENFKVLRSKPYGSQKK